MASFPSLSSDDMALFFHSHFSAEAVASFTYNYLNSAAFAQESAYTQHDEQMDQAEQDDLGYYHDGVKRTLTDEQINIFRQSELRDERRRQEQALKAQSQSAHVDENQDDWQTPKRQSPPQNMSQTRKNKKRGAPKGKCEPKPDLRKRTWDVVEKGLDSLDYD
ncbi:hypothetical protein CDD81_4078 [Ophiocordyceps australis]|uniref:Uncharacterized protein n=1 Tax=Ophiocordyceps australis TaxID=1399860 RepID=A0A2C5XDT8_9HYPO|nr:hypothetical protein CDD81_4078 [Ophiocordyceps australis]